MIAAKLQGLRNAWGKRPWGYLLAAAVLLAFLLAEAALVRGGLQALRGYGAVGSAVAHRLLALGLTILMASVAFSAVTTTVSTLYLSDDLTFLLSLPLPASRVFALKLTETYLLTAGLPSLLTLPLVWAIGRAGPWWYLPAALGMILALYALPVGIGALVTVVLMRVAPAGRVREIATGLGVALSAGLILLVRSLIPTSLLRASGDTQFHQLLHGFAQGGLGPLPSAVIANDLWAAAGGKLTASPWILVGAAGLLLWLTTALAALAYREGWVRGLEGSGRRRPGRSVGRVERLFSRFGALGHLALKDLRALGRDATQWSQLLILAALLGVYVISLHAYPSGLHGLRGLLVTLQLAFQGLILAGVGIRLAFPAVSLEGAGFWLLQSSPLSSSLLVRGKYLASLPAMVALALIMSWQSGAALKLGAGPALVAAAAALSDALAVTALGVGLGAAFPRFRADNPAEIPISPGGLLYLALALLYVGLTTAVASVGESGAYAGLGAVLVLGILTALGVILPLGLGSGYLEQTGALD